jgi:hypothetical protein
MNVNYEIKGMLAKLLAEEDIVVEHKKVETACFNVHTRVLTLPMWKASSTVVDLLVAHEVGHSRETPDVDWTKDYKIPPQFVNVTEDARVEKLMKRRYSGLSKTFYNGYKELNQQDFFCIQDEDISKFNLADRANLYFKIGNFIPLEFTSEEDEIINLIGSAETFEDALNAAEVLYKYCEKDQEEKEKISDTTADEIGNSKSPSDNPEESSFQNQNEEQTSDLSQSSSNQNQNKSDESENSQKPSQKESSYRDKEPEVQTMNNLENKIKDLVNNDNSIENIYVEVPQVNLDTVIAKNEKVHKEIDGFFKVQQKRYADYYGIGSSPFTKADQKFKEFKSSSQREVNYLVKEFECHKAADSYSRASTARTGSLDTSRLHSYKFSEDLFKKVTILPDGKNHGLVFILDWSGSMSEVLIDTCKQLFNLVWFCKKVSIPFEVYAFTLCWNGIEINYGTNERKPAEFKPHYQPKEGILTVDPSFSLMNLLTSKVSGKELEHQILNIWRVAYSLTRSYSCEYTFPNRLSLSGTPLNESLISLYQILPKFQQDNKLQKVHCIILTDGEAEHINYHCEVKRPYQTDPYMGVRHTYPGRTYLRDRKIGTTYKYEDGYFSDIILKNLKDRFPTVNFIGMRILFGRDVNRFVQHYHSISDKQYEIIQKDWKKLKSFTITASGYDAYFGLSANALSQDAEFEVAECATKSQIKSAFVKSLKSKKMNKKVLGDFISLVT